MKKYITIFIISLSILIVCAFSISFAKYQKSLQSDLITIDSKEHIPLEANIGTTAVEENQYDITITNNNDYEIKYKIQEENDLYNITSDHMDNGYFTIPANTTKTVTILLSGKQDVVYVDMQLDDLGNYYKNINLIVDEDQPYEVDKVEIATEVKVILQKTIKNQIIKSAETIINYEEGHAFTTISGSNDSGLCSIIDPVSGEMVYFFRGNVTNNYMQYAGKTWRILRINSDGSIRLILDDIIGTTQYQSLSIPTIKTIDAAIELLDWDNSIAKAELQTWYANNIEADYSENIVKSKFVFDTSYELKISSGTNNPCYYFGPYLRVGIDGASYQPTLSYNSESLIEDNIGLITADEISYAGGFWATANTSYFLYNSSITTDCWTMSPAFFGNASPYKTGVVIHGIRKSMHDWPSAQATLSYTLGLRPVISVRGDLEATGDGSKLTPYEYKN